MGERRALVDTGPLVAIVSGEDSRHRACIAALGSLPSPLLTCWPVLTEAAWLLRKRPVALAKLLEAFDAGMLGLLELGQEAVAPMAEFLRRYETIGAQLADAALVYLANRENIRTVFTLDRRDFSVYRLSRNRTFKIVPELE